MSPAMSNEQKLQLEAYKILVDILQNEDNLFWRRNEILIAINGGMLTVIGLMLTSQNATIALYTKVISIAICVIGVAVCVFWFQIAKRSEAFYNHWYEQLEFLETQYLAPVQIFSLADKYFSKGHVRIGKKDFKLDVVSSLMRMFTALQVLALIFSIVWLCIGIYLSFLFV